MKQPAVRRRFNKHEVCYSRATPLQQQRREHIDEIEFGLTQHPLALYPHLEECLPPDVSVELVFYIYHLINKKVLRLLNRTNEKTYTGKEA